LVEPKEDVDHKEFFNMELAALLQSSPDLFSELASKYDLD
jgi:hypothetical protein